MAGSDADLANLQFVAQGKEAVEIWKKVKPLAEKAAEVAVLLAQEPGQAGGRAGHGRQEHQQRLVDVPTIVTPIVAVTKDNLKDTVIKEGLYTEAQIYGK